MFDETLPPVAAIYSAGVGKTLMLGMVPTVTPPDVPKLAKYLRAGKGAPLPPKVDYTAKAMAALRRMYLNDRYGCCVIADKYHQLGVRGGNDGGQVVTGTDQEVLDTYTRWKAGPGDSGCNIPDVLTRGVQTGIVANGVTYKDDGFVSVNNANADEVKTAITLFGTVVLGLNLPESWHQSDDNSDWGPTNSEIIGGHDVLACSYDETGVIISTWGGLRRITWPAFTSRTWITECYAVLAPLWYGEDKIAPSLAHADALIKDMQTLRDGGLPDLPDAPDEHLDWSAV